MTTPRPAPARHPLDNPIWSSLTTAHAHLAAAAGPAARYPAAIAPFIGVASPDPGVLAPLEGLVAPGEHAYALAVRPPFGPLWEVSDEVPVLQMVMDGAPPRLPAPDFVEMGEAQREDMLGLTALVFPGFFRARTLEMGRYIGLYRDGVLAAMAGERMRITGWQEISAVCTHPDHQGRGYAHQLVAVLCRDAIAAGRQPFLHVYPENRRARSVYERLGFADRTILPLWSATRLDGQGAK